MVSSVVYHFKYGVWCTILKKRECTMYLTNQYHRIEFMISDGGASNWWLVSCCCFVMPPLHHVATATLAYSIIIAAAPAPATSITAAPHLQTLSHHCRI